MRISKSLRRTIARQTIVTLAMLQLGLALSIWPRLARAQVAATGARVEAVLSLADAMREADQRAFGNRVSAAVVAAQRARARLPIAGILPSARIEAGLIRTTDPIGAFGTTLRQRLVTPAAFDPARLNDPVAVTNMQSGLIIELPVLNLDAWTGVRAARTAANASSAAADWGAVNTRADVVRAYYGAVLSTEKIATLTQVQRAADAARRQVQAMMQQGLVTKADMLQAQVRSAEIASQLIGARNDAVTARQRLALLLGRVDAVPLTLPSALPSEASVRALAERDSVSQSNEESVAERGDVRATRAAAVAAQLDRRRAESALLPRVNSFARYDWNAPSGLFAGRKNWTVGVLASWSLFGGNRELADLAVASARTVGARAESDAAFAAGRLDADTTRRAVAVALERLDLAQLVDEQSREAHRLVEKRYVGGLATFAELLSAETSATSAALARSAARYAVIDAITMHRRAIGADPAALSALETAR